MSKAPDPYAQVEYRGRPMLNVDKAFCMAMEHELGYALTVVQAIGGSPLSAGTHLKGRALDLAFWDWERKYRAGRDLGAAAYPRTEDEGDWAEHVHQIVIFESRTNEKGVAPAGFRQIGSYDRGHNALANDAIDRYPYRPNPKVTFTRARYELIITGGLELPEPTPVTRMRDSMVEALHDLTVAIKEGRKVETERPVVQSTVTALEKDRREIRARLEGMPKR